LLSLAKPLRACLRLPACCLAPTARCRIDCALVAALAALACLPVAYLPRLPARLSAALACLPRLIGID